MRKGIFRKPGFVQALSGLWPKPAWDQPEERGFVSFHVQLTGRSDLDRMSARLHVYPISGSPSWHGALNTTQLDPTVHRYGAVRAASRLG